MQRAPRADRDAIRTGRLTICKEYSDGDVGIPVAGVENAGGLVRDESPVVNELCEGIYPSAIAQRLRPIGSISTLPPPLLQRVAAKEPSKYGIVP